MNPIRRAVLVMFMPSEQQATIAAIRSILPQLSSSDRLLLLCNGGLGNSLIKRLSGHPLVSCYEVEDNLGVAGGRNYLFATDEVKNAELIYILDNDLVVPSDYIDEMERFLLSQPDVAIAGPVILGFGHLRGRGAVLRGFVDSDDPTAPAPAVISDDLFSWAIESRDLPVVEHMGTNRNWRGAYLDDEEEMENVLRRLSGIPKPNAFRQVHARNQALVDRMLNREFDSLTTTNVGGGAQIIRRKLLDEIGTLSDLFNPYGYEDVDFALRSLHSGYRNLINTRCFILHGSDGRHAQRATPMQLHRRAVNSSRTTTLLEALWLPDEFPIVAFRRLARSSLFRSLSRVSRFQNLEALVFEMQGIQLALEQIAGAPCPLQVFRRSGEDDCLDDKFSVSDERWQSLRQEVSAKIDVVARRYMAEYTAMGGVKGGFEKLLQEKEDELRRLKDELDKGYLNRIVHGGGIKRATGNVVRQGATLASRAPVVGPFVMPSLRWLRRKIAP